MLRRTAMTALVGALGACGSHSVPPAPAPPQVGVLVAHAQSVPLTRNLVGRLSATRSADVRARVAGVLLKRLYKEGSDVKEGQALFQIDPAPLRAALEGAQAQLAQAEAQATNAHITAQRARELIASALVSRSDLDNAEAAERSTAAAVQQARAGVGTARINLGYASVTSPIAGRAGQQGVTEGALVGAGTATLLTTVEQIDPIYVNFDQPAIDIERLQRAQSSGNVTMAAGNQATVQLLLEDGTPYRAHRHARLSRPERRSGHRCGGAARHRAEPRPPVAAGHVRERAPDLRSGRTAASWCPRPDCSATAPAPTCSLPGPMTRSC